MEVFWLSDLQCEAYVVLCSLKDTCNILSEQDKVLESNFEHLNQKSLLTEYVKSAITLSKVCSFNVLFNKTSDCSECIWNEQGRVVSGWYNKKTVLLQGWPRYACSRWELDISMHLVNIHLGYIAHTGTFIKHFTFHCTEKIHFHKLRLGWNKCRQLVPLLTNRDISLIRRGSCIAAVCEVVCYMEVRPGLSGKKMRWHFSEQNCEFCGDPLRYGWDPLSRNLGRIPIKKYCGKTSAVPRYHTGQLITT